MKRAMSVTLVLILASVAGCQKSLRGGGVSKEDGFQITAPAYETSVKQGQLETVTVSLNRGDQFKRDVRLEIKADGLRVEPSKVVVKAGDKPDVQLKISAARDAALGEYRVTVKGTPETGEPTSIAFTVKVVAP